MDEMWVRLVSFLEALAPDTFHRALSLCVFICRWFDVRSCRRSDSQPSVVLQKKIPRLPPEHEHLKQLQCFEFFKVSLVGAPSRAVLMGTSAAVVCLYPGVLINSSTAARWQLAAGTWPCDFVPQKKGTLTLRRSITQNMDISDGSNAICVCTFPL